MHWKKVFIYIQIVHKLTWEAVAISVQSQYKEVFSRGKPQQDVEAGGSQVVSWIIYTFLYDLLHVV
jgi:hypothetical protein